MTTINQVSSVADEKEIFTKDAAMQNLCKSMNICYKENTDGVDDDCDAIRVDQQDILDYI